MDGNSVHCLYFLLPESTGRQVSWDLERLSQKLGERLRPHERSQRISLGPGPTAPMPHPLSSGQGRPCTQGSLSHLYSLSLPSFLQENVSLIKEINELRRELKLTRSQVYDLKAALKVTKKGQPQEGSDTGNVTSG